MDISFTTVPRGRDGRHHWEQHLEKEMTIEKEILLFNFIIRGVSPTRRLHAYNRFMSRHWDFSFVGALSYFANWRPHEIRDRPVAFPHLPFPLTVFGKRRKAAKNSLWEEFLYYYLWCWSPSLHDHDTRDYWKEILEAFIFIAFWSFGNCTVMKKRGMQFPNLRWTKRRETLLKPFIVHF